MSHQCRSVPKSTIHPDCRKLKFYEACLNIKTLTNVTFRSRPVECVGCVLNDTAKSDVDTKIILTQTYWPITYEIWNETAAVCKATYHFKEYGEYEINMSDITTSECLPKVIAEPDVALLSITNTAIILLLMITVWYFMLWPKHAAKYWFHLRNVANRIVFRRLPGLRKDKTNVDAGSTNLGLPRQAESPPAPKQPRPRLRSLDTFRGAVVLIMIFVHSGGYHLAAFHLSAWNGLTFVDVVFPSFAFAMGEALVLTMNARLLSGTKKIVALAQVVRRSLLLCCIGITRNLIYGGHWHDLQLTGVMQRLGAMYLIVGAVECAFNDSSEYLTDTSPFRDLAVSWRQWLVTLSLLAVQVCVSVGASAPGCPRGYMGPGGLHLSAHGQQLHNCTGGIAGHIDRTIIGPSHLWRWNSTAQKLYESPTSADSMGLLGCLSGIFVVQAGAQAFRILNLYDRARVQMTLRWLMWSMTLGLAGGAACGFSWNEGVIPINKTLTSLSYCLVTSSIAFLVQAVLFFFIDWKKIWSGRPFCYAGENSLLLYVGSEMLPLNWYKIEPTHSELLVTHAAVVLVWLTVAVYLHRSRMIITV